MAWTPLRGVGGVCISVYFFPTPCSASVRVLEVLSLDFLKAFLRKVAVLFPSHQSSLNNLGLGMPSLFTLLGIPLGK